MKTISVPLVALILWFMASWAIDTYLLRPLCLVCSDLFSVKIEVVFREAAELATKRVSLLILVLIPWIAYAFYVFPYKDLGDRRACRIAVQRWCQPFAFLVGAFLLAFFIEYFLYLPLREHLPDWIRGYAERFLLTMYPLFPALESVKLPMHLAGLLGLFFGLYAFLTRSWDAPR